MHRRPRGTDAARARGDPARRTGARRVARLTLLTVPVLVTGALVGVAAAPAQAIAEVTVTLTANPPGPVFAYSPAPSVTLTAAVTSPEGGTLEILDMAKGPVCPSASVTTLTCPNVILQRGVNEFTARFTTAVGGIVVESKVLTLQSGVDMTLTSSLNPSAVGQQVTFTATAPGLPPEAPNVRYVMDFYLGVAGSGYMDILCSQVPVTVSATGGTGTCTTSTLPVGTYELLADLYEQSSVGRDWGVTEFLTQVVNAPTTNAKACDGTLTGGTYKDVTVAPGKTCTLGSGVTVTHDVTVPAGGTLSLSGVSVGHDLTVTGGALTSTGAKVGHDLKVKGAPSVSISGGTVGHDLTVTGSGSTGKPVTVSGVTLIGHDLTVTGNTPDPAVSSNKAGHDATCQTGTTGSGNAAPHNNTCPKS